MQPISAFRMARSSKVFSQSKCGFFGSLASISEFSGDVAAHAALLSLAWRMGR
jgi:hypothetical protein